MLGDALEVYTRNARPETKDSTARNLRVEKMGSLAFVTEAAQGNFGTSVRVRLKQRRRSDYDDVFDAISEYLKEIVNRPSCPVSVGIGTTSFVIDLDVYYSFKHGGPNFLAGLGVVPILINIGRWSDRLWGTVILLFGKDSKTNRLSDTVRGKTIELTPTRDPGRIFIDPRKFVTEYKANRISVNGFRMGLRKIGQLFRRGPRYIAAILDIDVQAGSDITFDLSRRRLTGNGGLIVKRALRNAVRSGLDDLGIHQNLDEKAKLLLGTPRNYNEKDMFSREQLLSERTVRLDDEQTLLLVEKEIPEGRWPVGLHRILADRQGLSRTTVYRAISTLLLEGRVGKPKSGN